MPHTRDTWNTCVNSREMPVVFLHFLIKKEGERKFQHLAVFHLISASCHVRLTAICSACQRCLTARERMCQACVAGTVLHLLGLLSPVFHCCGVCNVPLYYQGLRTCCFLTCLFSLLVAWLLHHSAPWTLVSLGNGRWKCSFFSHESRCNFTKPFPISVRWKRTFLLWVQSQQEWQFLI